MHRGGKMRTNGKQNTEIHKRSRKQDYSTLMRLSKYLSKYKYAILAAFALTFLSNAFSLYAPKLTEKVISLIEMPLELINLNDVFSFGAVMVVFYIATFLLSILLSLTMLKLSQNIGHSLRKDTFNKFDRLPVSYFDTHQTGDTISKFTYDIDTVSASLGNNFISICTSIITLVGSFVMMILSNFTLMTSVFITMPISFAIGAFWTIKVRGFHREKSKKFGELNGFVEDKVTGHKTIKIYGQLGNILSKFKVKNVEWGKAHYKSEFAGGGSLRAGLMFVSNITTATIYVHGCFMLLSGGITLAEISAFILYAKMFTGVLNEITFILADIQSALAASDRVFAFLDEDEEKGEGNNSTALEKINGKIAFDNANFSYNKDREILKNIDIEVKENEVIAIVGSTGAGKTTLINLLMRFYHVNSGGIYIDGVNIENINVRDMRKSVAMVLQDTWLFGGTIFENIIYSKPNATKDEVIEIAKSISLHDSIMALPNGYDTVINESSVNISAGQKQLITIARVMLLDAKILLLDEATSNVDSLTELDIQSSMKKLMKGKTTFVIAHRLSTVRNADRIIVLENGEIIEIGTHEELLMNGKNYANLYNSQFENVVYCNVDEENALYA